MGFDSEILDGSWDFSKNHEMIMGYHGISRKNMDDLGFLENPRFMDGKVGSLKVWSLGVVSVATAEGCKSHSSAITELAKALTFLRDYRLGSLG